MSGRSANHRVRSRACSVRMSRRSVVAHDHQHVGMRAGRDTHALGAGAARAVGPGDSRTAAPSRTRRRRGACRRPAARPGGTRLPGGRQRRRVAGARSPPRGRSRRRTSRRPRSAAQDRVHRRLDVARHLVGRPAAVDHAIACRRGGRQGLKAVAHRLVEGDRLLLEAVGLRRSGWTRARPMPSATGQSRRNVRDRLEPAACPRVERRAPARGRDPGRSPGRRSSSRRSGRTARSGPAASAGRITCATCCARSAQYMSSSASGSGWRAGRRRGADRAAPGRARCRRARASRRRRVRPCAGPRPAVAGGSTCRDPSMPSKVTKRPPAVFHEGEAGAVIRGTPDRARGRWRTAAGAVRTAPIRK